MRVVIGVALATIACGRDAPPPAPAPVPVARRVTADAAPAAELLDAAPAAEPLDAAPDAPPPAAPPGDPAISLDVALSLTCAVRASGAVTCWGNHLPPYRIDGWTDIASISLSEQLLCGVHRGGRVECGPQSSDRITGDRMRIARSTLHGVTAARAVATFADAACVLERTGEVGCWLRGAPPEVKRSGVQGATALVMGLLENPEYRYAGAFYGCTLAGGRFACFDIRDARPLDGSNSPIGKRPLLRLGTPRVAKPTGLVRPLTQPDDSRLCAGAGAAQRCISFDSRLGYSDASPPAAPVDPLPADRVKQIARGYYHSCAIETTGVVSCWGRNDEGQLGRPGGDSKVPVPVAL
jgi:hypothetical protein